MINKIVLDSSVFCKLFLQESGRQQAIDLLTALTQQNYKVIAPSLFLYEVLAVATMSNFPVLIAYELIVEFQKTQLEFIELDRTYIEKTIEICELGHTKSGFPSFYLEIHHNCYFVTADKKHFSKTFQWGYIVLLDNWKKIL